MGAIDSGNTAWILTSASLVFLMTPGVAFFYGGMVRAKAVLNMLMLEAAALSVTMIIWTLWGWSIAYAGSDIGGIFGDPASGFLLKDSMVAQDGVFTATGLNGNNYPVSVDVAFQVAFAMITVALIDKYENFDKLTIAMLNEFIEKILVHERDRKGSIQTTQEVEIYFNFVGRFVPPAFGEVELTPEELEEIRKREERKDRLHQNYLKRKASGVQVLRCRHWQSVV